MLKLLMEKRRSPCPIACSLDIFGDKWTLLIVRDLVHGRRYYKDFLASPEKIATNILANRLARLVAAGLVYTQEDEATVGRFSYHLTPKGLTLKPMLFAMREWGKKSFEGVESY